MSDSETSPGVGHNSGAAIGGIAADRLRSVIERYERLEGERKALASDMRDIMSEAKSAGFDVKAIRTILRMRKQDADELEQQQHLVDTYAHSLGM